MTLPQKLTADRGKDAVLLFILAISVLTFLTVTGYRTGMHAGYNDGYSAGYNAAMRLCNKTPELCR